MNPKLYWTILVAVFAGGILAGQMQSRATVPVAPALVSSAPAIVD